MCPSVFPFGGPSVFYLTWLLLGFQAHTTLLELAKMEQASLSKKKVRN